MILLIILGIDPGLATLGYACVEKNGNNFKKIDYGTISVLTSLNDDLRYKKILLKTILPDNPECKKFMIDSGYLNNLVDSKGSSFPKCAAVQIPGVWM